MIPGGRIELAVFDLDGTLIDSRLDLANSVNASRAHMGLTPIANETVYSYVGNGAPVLIKRALGPEASESDVDKALQFFLTYYREHKLDETKLYPGVQEALDTLLGAEIPMAVLTNKPVRISEEIVQGLGLEKHFLRVYGGNSFVEKKPHPIGIDTLVVELNIDRAGALMVGDSGVDVRTARNAGIRACGVRFGFQPDTFEEHPPDFLVDRMEEMAEIVLASRRG